MIKNCLRDNRPYPKAIQDAPTLELGEIFYYLAFQHLTTCRNYELGPIPYNVVNAYAYEYELDDEQRESLYYVIDKLDIWFLDKEIKKIKSKNKGGKK